MYGRKSWWAHRGDSLKRRGRTVIRKCFISVKGSGWISLWVQRNANPRAPSTCPRGFNGKLEIWCGPVVGAVEDGLGGHFVWDSLWGNATHHHLHRGAPIFSSPPRLSQSCGRWWPRVLEDHSERVDQNTKGLIRLSSPFSILHQTDKSPPPPNLPSPWLRAAAFAYFIFHPLAKGIYIDLQKYK